MDKINFGILEKISDMTKIGRYIIIAPEEFFDGDDENAVSALRNALCELADEGYIDLKYSGEDMFCVAPLKPLPPPPEDDEPKIKRRALKLPDIRTAFFGGMLGGLAGSILGGLIITLIFAVVYAR